MWKSQGGEDSNSWWVRCQLSHCRLVQFDRGKLGVLRKPGIEAIHEGNDIKTQIVNLNFRNAVIVKVETDEASRV